MYSMIDVHQGEVARSPMASHADSGAPEQCQLCGAACYTIMSKMVTHVMLAAPATRYRRDPHAITHYGVRGSRLHTFS